MSSNQSGRPRAKLNKARIQTCPPPKLYHYRAEAWIAFASIQILDPKGMKCAAFQTIMVRALKWLAHRPPGDLCRRISRLRKRFRCGNRKNDLMRGYFSCEAE